MSSITGNVTVAFAVLSYSGTLVVTAVGDPQHCPDLPVLIAHLQSDLDLLTSDRTAGVAEEGKLTAGGDELPVR